MADIQQFMYRTPDQLSRSPTVMNKVLLIGSCTVQLTTGHWSAHYGINADFIHILNVANNKDLDVSDFSFILMSVPLDAIVPIATSLNIKYDDQESESQRFEAASAQLHRILDEGMYFSRTYRVPTFVCNFLVPQQNPVGRFMPRYDLRNPVYFTEKLNEELAHAISGSKNVYLLDADSIASVHGKKFLMDDSIWKLSHGGVLSDSDFHTFETKRDTSQTRLEPIPSMFERMDVNPDTYWGALCAESLAMFRTLNQIDAVKMVIVDLDDTLWRGIAAEHSEIDPFFMLEGIHLGIVEALDILKKRGVLLAISSKNDFSTIERLWGNVFPTSFPMSNFFSIKIDWSSKADNVDKILKEANILAKNAIFIDDNPKERSEVQSAFPEMRILGDDFYAIRRLLLWSSETQLAQITDESIRRTEMVQRQILRENVRQMQTREEFLEGLSLTIKTLRVRDVSHESFNRIVELLNKTNQFNTTGKRYTHAEIEKKMASGATVYGFDVTDKYSHYGIVCVAIVENNVIETFAMSCRVMGMDSELGAIAVILEDAFGAGEPSVEAVTLETEFNLLSRDLYKRLGFSKLGEGFSRDLYNRIGFGKPALGDRWRISNANERPQHITFI